MGGRVGKSIDKGCLAVVYRSKLRYVRTELRRLRNQVCPTSTPRLSWLASADHGFSVLYGEETGRAHQESVLPARRHNTNCILSVICSTILRIQTLHKRQFPAETCMTAHHVSDWSRPSKRPANYYFGKTPSKHAAEPRVRPSAETSTPPKGQGDRVKVRVRVRILGLGLGSGWVWTDVPDRN